LWMMSEALESPKSLRPGTMESEEFRTPPYLRERLEFMEEEGIPLL
jgi:hypothetical protein